MENLIEKICEECGKPFETSDTYATLCSDCWEKIITTNGDGKGDE